MNVISEQVFHSFFYCFFHIGRSFIRRDFSQRLQRFYNAHVAGMPSPTLLPLIIGPACRSNFYSIIKPLISDDPVYPLLNSHIIKISKSYQAPDHVSGKAGQHIGMLASFFAAEIGKTAAFPVLRVLENELMG